MSRASHDVRVSQGDPFFECAPDRENSNTFFFRRLDRTRKIARVDVTLRNETWVDVWAEKAVTAAKSLRSRAAARRR